MTQLQLTPKAFFDQDSVKGKFAELLGKKSTGFITSVLQIVSSNAMLKNAEPQSIFHAAAVAATLDLPLNNNLGFAYIVPYNTKQPDGTSKVVAQFQMGYKGFIQLAQRSGQFKTISAAAIYEGQIVAENPLDGFEFDFTAKKSEMIVGYAAKFKLINGFEKTLYMTLADIKKHGGKYSKSFGFKTGLWNQDFEAMAIKTVIKLLLSKFAPLSIEMQQAVITDQALINDAEGSNVTYVDHEDVTIDKEAERAVLMIGDCQTVTDLISLKESLPESVLGSYEAKLMHLMEKEAVDAIS